MTSMSDAVDHETRVAALRRQRQECCLELVPAVAWLLFMPPTKLTSAGLTQVLIGRELNNAQDYELDVRCVERSSGWADLLVLVLTPLYILGPRGWAGGGWRRSCSL
jgi:hypothetical protein